MNSTELDDIVIFDQTESCPYLQGRMARMPLRMPIGKITARQTDLRLADGHRRTGEFIYQTHCPGCHACVPVRLKVADFRFSSGHRRTLNRGDRQLTQQFGPLVCDPQRLDLFNKHRKLRGLSKKDGSIDQEEYEWGFVRSCFESFEITYWIGTQLVGLAVCDLGESSLSAVYTFFDPELPKLSIGTYSILKQVQLCQERSLEYLYLGYYVQGSPHMEYKSRFVPQQRRQDGAWVEFGKSEK